MASHPRLLLINPSNPLVSITHVRESHWNRYRVWKPLGLMVLAGLTPPPWEITIVDENLGIPTYEAMSNPTLVGLTAFTSQAGRAYSLAAHFRRLGIPVVMGGIHATMCREEASAQVDSIVIGEAESVWARVLDDVQRGTLQPCYDGGYARVDHIAPARHDLLPPRYALGAIQTSRGCPLSCNFCSVTAFNGARYRQRPIDDVVREFQGIRESLVLVVDDNFIGTRADHIARSKELFRAMIAAKLRKEWIAQVTINFADDDELLTLAARAGCRGVFIGFESATPEGLREVGKKFNLQNQRDFRASVRRIQRHNILIVGSFIIGLDVDHPGIGQQIANTATEYGLDSLNTLFLTPLPGTRLWDQHRAAGRIVLSSYPDDWQYYTLTYPVTRYSHLSLEEVLGEMLACDRSFYSLPRTFHRIWKSIRQRRNPLFNLLGNLSYRSNIRLNERSYARFIAQQGSRFSQDEEKPVVLSR